MNPGRLSSIFWKPKWMDAPNNHPPPLPHAHFRPGDKIHPSIPYPSMYDIYGPEKERCNVRTMYRNV